jgi:hypothetical protein
MRILRSAAFAHPRAAQAKRRVRIGPVNHTIRSTANIKTCRSIVLRCAAAPLREDVPKSTFFENLETQTRSTLPAARRDGEESSTNKSRNRIPLLRRVAASP